MQEFILERVKIFQYEVCAYLLVKPVLALQNLMTIELVSLIRKLALAFTNV